MQDCVHHSAIAWGIVSPAPEPKASGAAASAVPLPIAAASEGGAPPLAAAAAAPAFLAGFFEFPAGGVDGGSRAAAGSTFSRFQFSAVLASHAESSGE